MLAQQRLQTLKPRAGAVGRAQREPERCVADPVTSAFVSEQVTMAANAEDTAIGCPAERGGASACDHDDAWPAVEGTQQRRLGIVADCHPAPSPARQLCSNAASLRGGAYPCKAESRL